MIVSRIRFSPEKDSIQTGLTKWKTPYVAAKNHYE